MDLVIITFIVIGVAAALDQYYREKRTRESKLNEIARKLKAIEKKSKSKNAEEG